MQLDLAQHDLAVSVADDRCMRSDDGSMSTDRSATTTQYGKSSQSPRRHRKYDRQQSSSSVNYHGTDIYQAAADGNLPLCVLLWGMATAKRINLMDPDSHGNTPMHYAALADLPEVMGFFLKQGRNRNNQENRLLDSRNALGETPLLRASTVGKIPSVKFLLDEGADPFCSDHLGNTIFINLARFGRIWGLHFVYSTLCDKFGYEYASQLLVASDVSDNNALDWAADSGEVNIIEYLIRRNMNPLRTNYNGRTALHIAAKHNRVEAARFLVKCGCDPFQLSRDNESPMSIAVASKNREIRDALKWKNNRGKSRHAQLSKFSSSTTTRIRAASRDFGSLVGIAGGHDTSTQTELESGDINTERKNTEVSASPPGPTFAVIGNEGTTAPTTTTAAAAVSSPSLLRDPDPGLSLYTVNKQGARRPHAIFRIKPSRIKYALFYGVVVVGYWILAICVRFYVWAILVVLSVFLFRHIEKKFRVAEAEKDSKHTHSVTGRSRFQELILAPEKFLGVYMGMTTTCVLYWLCALRMGMRADFYSTKETLGPGSIYLENLKNRNLALPPLGKEFLDIGGLSGSTDDTALFCAAFIALILAGLAWGQLTWFSTDPGAIYSRYEDFDMIMDQCLTTLAPAPGQLYCRTSMVKKPLRSKYCIQTGFVIARMDHFCVWLNNSVGYGNHRTFIVFLFLQFVATSLYSAMLIRALYREMGVNPTACWALSHLFDRLYFLPTVLCAALLAISLTIGALLVDQTYNIAKNITTNERLNRGRYPWMTDHLGNPSNRFDRGFISNFLEFWCAPGYRKNYYNEFSDPPSTTANEPLEKSPLVSRRDSGYATRRDSVDSTMSGLDPYRSRSNTFSPPMSNNYNSDCVSVGDTEQPMQSFPRYRPPPSYPMSPMSKSHSYDQSGLISPGDLFAQDDPSQLGGQNSFSTLTRAQEAHLQFEARVQHAIEMSHSSSDARTDERFQGPGSPGPPQDGVSTHWGQHRDVSRDSMRVATGDAFRSVRTGRADESSGIPPFYPQMSSDLSDVQQIFSTHGLESSNPRSSSFLSIDTSTGPDMHAHNAPMRRFSPGAAGGKSYERSVPRVQRPNSIGGYLPHQERKHHYRTQFDEQWSQGPHVAPIPVQLRSVDSRVQRSVDSSKMDDD